MLNESHNKNVSSLIIKRLIVRKGLYSVYDQKFNLGVNIIRGDNGTGKSTIIDLLYYGLGAEITDWTEEQEKCDETVVDVFFNYNRMCLKREITDTGKAAMFIYEGSIEQALADEANWYRFPNARNKDTHSYSQQLFNLLGLPSHKTDDSKNLTMHQILRLMYVDQLTQPTKLLKEDKKYDNSTIRKAIGEYLLGIDDLEAHNLRQDLIEANGRFESLQSELKAIYRFLGEKNSLIRREQINLEIDTLIELIIELKNRREDIRQEKIEVLAEKVRKRVSSIQSELEVISIKKSTIEERKMVLNSEIVDTKYFLNSLHFRKKSIEQSRLVNTELGAVIFKYCPSCLSPIESKTDEHNCGLCKTDLSKSKRHYSYIQMINEINFQIRESEDLTGKYRKEVDSINSEIPAISHRLEFLKNEYVEITANADAVDAELSEVGSEIGFNRSQISSLKEKLGMVDQVENLIERKNKANEMISELRNKLELLEALTKNRYDHVYSDIEQIARGFIEADGGYEEVFKTPEDVTLDFGRDKMTVNGRSKFSASSMVIMKNAIRVAIFIHSVNDKMTRFPRFMLLDNVEDKGMMASRSQNFQRVLVEKCDELKNDYQIIFTTSMIDEDLNKSDYVIGPFYKKGEHTLKFSN